MNLKGQRPVDDILNAPEVPQSVRAYGLEFKSLILELVRFVAVEYESSTMSLYFIAPGPVSETQAAQYTALAKCKPSLKKNFEICVHF